MRHLPHEGPNGPAWAGFFWEAFRRSRNPMVLLDDSRRHVEVNGAYLEVLGYPRSALIGQPIYLFVVGGPLMSAGEWRSALRREQFSGVAKLRCHDGTQVKVEFAGHPEMVTGRQLVLAVALRTARGIRRLPDPDRREASPLSAREMEVVQLISLGLTGPEIANELHLTHNTVRTHVRNAMTKAEARSRAHLVAKSLADGSCCVPSQQIAQTLYG